MSEFVGVPATRKGIETTIIYDSLGISPQLLSYWIRKLKIVYPSVRRGKKGFSSLWSFFDVLDIKTILRLRRQGLSMQKVRKVVNWLRDNGHALHSANLATNGDDVWINLNDQTVEILKKTDQMILLDWRDIVGYCIDLMDKEGIDR